MPLTLTNLKTVLQNNADAKQAVILQRFFKTGPGEYGAGDKFLGIRVPILRTIAKEYQTLPLASLSKLIKSKLHEERLVALFIVIFQYKKAGKEQQTALQQNLYEFYVAHFPWINNWDLVDLSAPQIVGDYLFGKDRKILQAWARTENLWQRRIAVVATHNFIRENHFQDTLNLVKMLLNDTEDLMHKACGWMLREIGKRDLATLEKFLQKYYPKMPRTMLRYAIERFPEEKRLAYLHGRV